MTKLRYSNYMKAAHSDHSLLFCSVCSERNDDKSFWNDACTPSFICLHERGAGGHVAIATGFNQASGYLNTCAHINTDFQPEEPSLLAVSLKRSRDISYLATMVVNLWQPPHGLSIQSLLCSHFRLWSPLCFVNTLRQKSSTNKRCCCNRKS